LGVRNRIEEEPYEEPHINLTPLIDVVFVVLITFMVIAPLLDADKVQLAAGSEQAKRVESSGSISVTVKQDNTIWVDGRNIALSELRGWLTQARVRNPKAVPKLIHDKRAQFGTYQEIKNILETCGFEEMDLLVQQQ
jgi:biopolymer transport protein ExbD